MADKPSVPTTMSLIDDLYITWRRWKKEEELLRFEGYHSKASTKRMCMEDIDRLLEKYGGRIDG